MEKKIVKKEGLDDHFEFLGRKPREEIPKYIMRVNACLDSFPSESYFVAAHLIKLLECGACDKPVVATNVSKTANLIKHGKFGYLTKPGNPEEYADYLVTLLKSENHSPKNGCRFSNFVRENFDWKNICLKINDNLLNLK